MPQILIMLCAVIWLPVLVYLIHRRGFLVLLIWLLIAPSASNVVNQPGKNPFYESAQSPADGINRSTGRVENSYLTSEETIKLKDFIEPTRLLLATYLIFFLLELLVKRRMSIPFDRTETWMAIFSAILFASTLSRSNRLTFAVHIALDVFFVPFLGYFVARRLVRTEDRLRQLIRVMGYMGISVILMSLVERFTHGGILYRLRGPFKLTNPLYVVMAVVFLMMLLDKQALNRGLRWFLLGWAPVIILLNWTRGDWVGFFLAVGVLSFLSRHLISSRQKLGTIGLSLIVASLIMTALPLVASKEIVENRIGDTENVEGRLATWSLAIQQGVQNPVFGLGLNNLRDVLAKRRLFGKVESYTTVHNSYLALFVELGIVGLAAYLAIVASIIRLGITLYRASPDSRYRYRGAIIIAVMIAYLVPALFAATLHVLALSHVYVFVCIGALAAPYGGEPRESRLEETRKQLVAIN